MPLLRRRPDSEFVAYVHIGNPKCASTSLQMLLARHKQIAYLGKKKAGTKIDPRNSRRDRYGVSFYSEEPIGWSIRREIPGVSDISYDSAMVRGALGGAVDKARADGHEAIHLSDEVLSGIGLSLYRMHREPVGTIARRLVEGLGVPVTFLYIPRAQPAFLWSYYRQLLTSGYPLSFEGFVKDLCVLPDGSEEQRVHAASGIMGHLMYDRVVEAVRQHGELAVVPFEEMVSGQMGVDKALEALGLEPGRQLQQRNPGNDDPVQLLETNSERLRGVAGRVPTALLRADVKRRRRWATDGTDAPSWQESITAEMTAAFAASNERLAASIGVDLRSLGYPMPDRST